MQCGGRGCRQCPVLGRSADPQSEEAPSSTKVADGATDKGGWGQAKQVQNGGASTSSEEADFENLPF